MSHYKSNLRDLEFNLFEVFGADDFMGKGGFEEMDPDTVRSFLKQTEEIASGPLSDTYTTSDRNPPVFDPKNNTVTMPEDFKAAFQTLMESEGWRMEIPEAAAIRDGSAWFGMVRDGSAWFGMVWDLNQATGKLDEILAKFNRNLNYYFIKI